MINPDTIETPTQETASLTTELAAPEPVALEPDSDATDEILSSNPENIVKEEMDNGVYTEGLSEEVGSKQDDFVNKVTWAQVGRVTEPGRHMFRFGWLTITPEDLVVWQTYPNAAFTLFKTATGQNDTDEFRLGTFELRIGANYAESEK